MKILGYDYKVVSESNMDEAGAMGRCHPKSQRLQISSDIHEQQKVSSILHEIIEALNYHLELKLEHQSVMSLEASLYQVLTENGVDLSPLAKDILKP